MSITIPACFVCRRLNTFGILTSSLFKRQEDGVFSYKLNTLQKNHTLNGWKGNALVSTGVEIKGQPSFVKTYSSNIEIKGLCGNTYSSTGVDVKVSAQAHVIIGAGWYGRTLTSTGVDLKVYNQPAEIKNLLNIKIIFKNYSGWYGNAYSSTGVENKIAYQPVLKSGFLNIKNG